MGGTGLLHGCLRFVSWPCVDTTAAGIGHSDVTLPQCWRETKQDMNVALVLQTSLGAKAMPPVTVFAVYTANYRDSFSGASLCTLGSLIPSAPSRALHLTNNLGTQKTAHRKSLLLLQLLCSMLWDLCSTDSPGALCSGCPGHRRWRSHGVCLNPCAQRLLQGSFGGLSRCDGASKVASGGRILWSGNLLFVVLFWGFVPCCVISDLNL